MIPIAKPYFDDAESQAVQDVLNSGWVSQGPKVQEFEASFSEYVKAPFACALSSCTAGLQLALKAVGVRPGDVVITVSHSFIATANAIRAVGAEPVFIDIDPLTFNMDSELLEHCLMNKCISEDDALYFKDIAALEKGESPLTHYMTSPKGRIGAVLVVHQMGIPADLASILSLSKKFNLPVVEDAACAIGSQIRLNDASDWEFIGKPHGDAACFSFHPRKILTTGDGGMVTTSSSAYNEKLRLWRQHGMSVSDCDRHLSKDVVFEEYVETGFNYRMTDIQACLGVEQLKKLPMFLQANAQQDQWYRKNLAEVEEVRLPQVTEYARCNWQSYPISVTGHRNQLMQYLLDKGIMTRPGIMNAHQEDPYQAQSWHLPMSEKARETVVLLPIYFGMTEKDNQFISQTIKDFILKAQ